MNPFDIQPQSIWKSYENWAALNPLPKDKEEMDPYTRTRIILMNGAEFEANAFLHQYARHCPDNDLRREMALVRQIEQQQQKKLTALKPARETILEHTIGYEQLAVDLTARMARREPDPYVKQALDFALLEDFDHLYRYSDLLEGETGTLPEKLVGGYTELMPGRPTISHHRWNPDNVRRPICGKKAAAITRLNTAIITAAEQQTMNYYMNIAGFWPSEAGRALYREIAMVEEEHVSQYESLMDPTETWLEKWLCHEYAECYLYWSCRETETDSAIKPIWDCHLQMEIQHLHKAAEMMEKYEHKAWQEVLPNPAFPEPLDLGENIDYVRGVLGSTVHLTSKREDYLPVADLGRDDEFFKMQEIRNGDLSQVASHTVIEDYIKEHGKDYRWETAENPVRELRDRRHDNTQVGRE